MNRVLISLVLNAITAAVTAAVTVWHLRGGDGNTDEAKRLEFFRYFTNLSNMFSGIVSLCMCVALLPLVISGTAAFQEGGAVLPEALLMTKYLATGTVTVTLMTVLLFLGPTFGYAPMFAGDALFLHLIGPLLAITSFCFVEKQMRIGFPALLIGVLPVAAYGTFYLYKAVTIGEENGGWPDFYGFNKDGKWKVSFVMMMLAAVAISAGLALIHNAGI